MKAKLHLPVEQYGFVEVEMEVDSVGDAVAEYQEARKTGPGLEKKAYDAFLERQLLGENNHIEEYLKMSKEKQDCVQTIKRALNRIEAKQNKS